jgi:DnaJ-class molecular chaperone
MSETAVCATCGGRGRATCATCGGNGRVVRTADGRIHLPHTPLGRMWRGDQGSTCTTCAGKGTVACRDCKGTGRRP